MNQLYPTVLPFPYFPFSRQVFSLAGVVLLLFTAQTASAQAVSGIVTDYNGYWKTSTSSINSIKPENNHNLLAFTFNGVTYSTGVNDGLLTSKGNVFQSNDFWSLPVGSISGTINGDTKVGVGEKYDGVTNGPSNPPPTYDIAGYLTDGIKGLNIGTCIANLPHGSMTFIVSNIKPSSIGDGVPDILVTQVADPSSSFDRYLFTDVNGTRVGNYKDIVFTSITPVGNWTADFYEASSNPLRLTSGFTKTDRHIRLWAADLSEFGITVANYQTVRNFRIDLSGTSDVAFVGYSARSFSVAAVLPVTITEFTGKKHNNSTELKWTTQTEANTAWYVIEKSNNNNSFTAIDSVKAAGNSASTLRYSYTDKNAGAGTSYYRLKTVDRDGHFTYSSTVLIAGDKIHTAFSIHPNPATATSVVTLRYETAEGNEQVQLYNAAGLMLSQQTVSKGSTQTKLNLRHYPIGIYYVVLQSSSGKRTQKLLIRE